MASNKDRIILALFIKKVVSSLSRMDDFINQLTDKQKNELEAYMKDNVGQKKPPAHSLELNLLLIFLVLAGRKHGLTE